MIEIQGLYKSFGVHQVLDGLDLKIRDGETLVIGGLLKNQTTDTNKKIPVLGDVPIVGYAFRKKEKSVTKTDLLIFLTPHIITPEMDPDSKS